MLGSIGSSACIARPRVEIVELEDDPLARNFEAADVILARSLKIGARVIETAPRIRVHLPASSPERAVYSEFARGLMRPAPT